MNEDDPTGPHEIAPAGPGATATAVQGSSGAAAELPTPPPLPPGRPASSSATEARGVRRLLSNRRRRWGAAAAAALVCSVIGASVGLASSPSTTAGQVAPATVPAVGFGSGGSGSNARSGPAPGGSAGTIISVSTAGFTISTSAGQKVAVNEASSTTYQQGTNAASASVVTTGEPALVLGTVNGTTITATQVIVQPTVGLGSATSSAVSVVPFQRGAPTTSKQVGQIPANYSQGSGTIVSGTAANTATEAALAAYPGGVVDRVVKLSTGQYEVHYIGVNWPHHIFVGQDFAVIGAN